MKTLACMLLVLLLSACAAPYRAPVAVYGATPFTGLAQAVADSPGKTVDVLLIHGMCTHDGRWADAAIDSMVAAARSDYQPAPQSMPAPAEALSAGVEVLQRTEGLAGGTVRFSALLWSGMTQALKRQLDYDATGVPSDCRLAGACKPKRATLNGRLKDWLMNDCLADAVVYQGASKASIRTAMIAAMTAVVEGNAARDARAGLAAPPLVLVADSLGSKIVFDALYAMFNADLGSREKSAADLATRRLVHIFMRANQLPFLSLSEQGGGAPSAEDSLDKLLVQASEANQLNQMTLVAFSDPNDILSYRLMPTRYAGLGIRVVDVLVSNDNTYLGLLENPLSAHTGYMRNKEVSKAIVCGLPKSRYCK